MRRRTLKAVLLLLVAALLVAACGDDDDDSDASDKDSPAMESTSSTAAAASSTTAAPGGTAAPTKPTVEVPAGAAPTQLVIKDITVGTGAEAAAGKTVSMQYVGVKFADKKQFDSSWDRAGQKPFSFQLGANPPQVIEGWEKGVPGMKVGGRRQLVIPGNLAYGAAGAPDAGIGPNETLVFVIDLVGVQ